MTCPSIMGINQAGGQGGGIHHFDGNAEIHHSTIATNFAAGGSCGVVNVGGSLKASHSLFALNSGTSDVVGSLESLGHNLISNASAVTLSGDTATVKMNLPSGLSALLRDNGGPTFTHALTASSPAIDGGANLPERDVTSPNDVVAQGGKNQSPPSAAPGLAFDNNPATVYRSYDTNLLALWDFNSAASPTTATDRVADRPAQLLNVASFSLDGEGRTGLPGDRAMLIANAADTLHIANAAFLNAAAARDAITVSFWQKRTAPISDSAGFAVTSPSSFGTAGLAIQAPISSGDHRIEFASAAPTSLNQSLVSPNLGSVNWTNWHHVAVVKNGFQRQIFLDGVLVATGTSAPPLIPDFAELYFGFGRRGFYDDLAIYDAALSPAQIATLASASVPPASAEFVISPSVGLATVNALQLTSAPDSPASDPSSYLLEGSMDGETYYSIAEGDIPPFQGRSSTQTIPFDPSDAYSHFRLGFLSAVDPTATPMIQIGEIALLDRPTIDQRDRRRLSDGDGNKIRTIDIGAYEAQGYIVDSPLDDPPVEIAPEALSGIQLRSALQSSSPADIIRFAPSMDGRVIVISAGLGPLKINSDVSISTANLPNSLFIGGQFTAPGLFEITSGASMDLEGVTLMQATDSAIANFGTLNLRRASIIQNYLTDKAGAAIENYGTAFLENCTISGNTALSSNAALSRGAAIANHSNLYMNFTTVSNNFASGETGGVYNHPGALFWPGNSIIADNLSNTGHPDVFGGVSSQSYNHIGSASGNSGWDISDTFGPALISPLSQNGSPLLTHAPKHNSPVLNSGGFSQFGDPPTDQRGASRLVGAATDRGAHEHNPADLLAGNDYDGDSLPDRFERFYGMDIGNPGDAILDLDKDGFTALQEFGAQTNPLDFASKFAVDGFLRRPDGKFQLSWDSVPGVVYSVWSSNDLRRYKPVDGSTVTAGGSTTTFILDPGSEPSQFYRVRVGPGEGTEVRSGEEPGQ